MSAEQIPTKAAPAAAAVRKAPPRVPTVPTAGQPETGLHVAVQQFLAVVRAGRRGGWRAWEPLAAQIDMEDRTALMEFVAVLSMVPPANAPTAGQIQEHMSTLFPARATTATAQETTPTVAAPPIPTKAYPGAPPSTWAGQVQWQPPAPRSTAAGSDPTAVSGTTFLDTPSVAPPTRTTTASFLGAEPTSRPFFNLSAMEAESALPSGASTPAPRMVAQHSVDEAGVRTRLPPEGAVHPLSRRQSRQASPSTRAGAAEQRAAAQDTGATSPTSSVAPTEVVFEAASSLLFGMDNLNNGDPQFDPRASTTPAAEGTGRRGRSQRRHGEQRPATSQDPPPPEPTVDVPPAFRRPLVAAPVPWASTPPSPDQEQLPAGPHADGAGPGTRSLGHAGEQSGRHGRRSVGT